MTLQNLDGTCLVPIGPGYSQLLTGALALGTVTIDAVNEAVIYIGQIFTSDYGSHTLNTSGSSQLEWRTAAVTFSDGGTTVKVGLADVDAATGPPARAVNSSDVITFDVSADFTGGGGGITANAWQVSVPTTGSKTVAHGDLIAFAIQMTARGGSDTVTINQVSSAQYQRPTITAFTGGSYASQNGVPLCIVKFTDGAFGYFYASDVMSAITARNWNSGSATKEYGQLFKMPFPMKIYGIYGWLDPDAGCDIVLYSDPLGTPVAEKTVAFDVNVVAVANLRRFSVLFSSPYTTTADQIIAAVFKPGASSVNAFFKTLGHADHRVSDPGGTDSYGISRASGAFADANSGLDHYYIGLLAGAFGDDAGGAGGGMIVNPGMSGRLVV